MNIFKAIWNFLTKPSKPVLEAHQEKFVIDVCKSTSVDNAEVCITYQSSKANVAIMEKALRHKAYTVLTELSSHSGDGTQQQQNKEDYIDELYPQP